MRDHQETPPPGRTEPPPSAGGMPGQQTGHRVNPSGRTLTILVVEDDDAVAELLRTVLNRVRGWGATVVHDAAAAAEVFQHVEVEVLVVDVNLPGISGPELLEHLRRDPHWREPPVLLMSGRPDQPLVEQALERAHQRHEPLRFLAKPFDVDQLVDEVAAAARQLRRTA